jgi:hypothetical protein
LFDEMDGMEWEDEGRGGEVLYIKQVTLARSLDSLDSTWFV